MTISEEELFGALMELKDASQAMVEAQHGNDQDIWAISDRQWLTANPLLSG